MRKLPAKAGLNRFVWDLRHTDAARFKGLILWAGNTRGPAVRAGRVPGAPDRAAADAHASLSRCAATRGSRRRRAEFAAQLAISLRSPRQADRDARGDRAPARRCATRSRTARRPREADGRTTRRCGPRREALDKKLTKVEEALYQTKNQSSQDPLNYPIRLNNKLAALAGVRGIARTARRPTQAQEVYDDLAAKIDAQLADARAGAVDRPGGFNRLVREQDVPAVVIKTKA